MSQKARPERPRLRPAAPVTPYAGHGHPKDKIQSLAVFPRPAWTIYNDQRNRRREPEQEPEADSIARQVRITLRDQDLSLPPGTERITEVVATEIIRLSKESQE